MDLVENVGTLVGTTSCTITLRMTLFLRVSRYARPQPSSLRAPQIVETTASTRERMHSISVNGEKTQL